MSRHAPSPRASRATRTAARRGTDEDDIHHGAARRVAGRRRRGRDGPGRGRRGEGADRSGRLDGHGRPDADGQDGRMVTVADRTQAPTGGRAVRPGSGKVRTYYVAADEI